MVRPSNRLFQRRCLDVEDRNIDADIFEEYAGHVVLFNQSQKTMARRDARTISATARIEPTIARAIAASHECSPANSPSSGARVISIR